MTKNEETHCAKTGWGPRTWMGTAAASLSTCALALFVCAVLLSACAEASPDELFYIQDDQRSVSAPGIIGARANGKGCASSKGDALEKARRSAWYNLRSVTGQGRYTVKYRIIDFIPSAPDAQNYFCYEVEAESMPVR